MPSQYVNLMPKDQDLGCQRGRDRNNNTSADQIRKSYTRGEILVLPAARFLATPFRCIRTMRGEGARPDHAGGLFFHRGGISAERLATSMLRYTLACMTDATASAQMISNSTFGLRAYIL